MNNATNNMQANTGARVGKVVQTSKKPVRKVMPSKVQNDPRYTENWINVKKYLMVFVIIQREL